MSIFNSLVTRIRAIGVQKATMLGICTLAVAGSFGLGLATRGNAAAASVRDGSSNSINNGNYHGGAGCLTAEECYFDMKENKPGDLQTIYNHFGLSPEDYQRWRTTAKMGKTFKNGDVYVNNQIVMTGANSMGREKFNSQRKSINIGGKTYYYSRTQDSFSSSTDSIDTLVMFDKNGVVETALLTACGNPVWGTNVKPSYGCKALNKSAVSGQEDTYRFTTDAFATKNASISKVVYNFGDGSAEVTKSKPTDAVDHKFTRVGTWTIEVTVHVNLPGGQTTTVKCKTTITVKEKVVPAYACEKLIATSRDNTNRSFRFTVHATAKNGATLKDADFTLDGNVTTTGVTTKDDEGNIYRDYNFTDATKHTIVAKVNFNVAGGVQSDTCEASVTPTEEPKCTVPGKEDLPPNHPDCKEDEEMCPVEGKETLPKDSEECKEEEVLSATTELPKTGPAGLLGIFASATGAGAAIHRIVLRRRAL